MTLEDDSQWWCRPDPETVVRISERTGLSVQQVRADDPAALVTGLPRR